MPRLVYSTQHPPAPLALPLGIAAIMAWCTAAVASTADSDTNRSKEQYQGVHASLSDHTATSNSKSQNADRHSSRRRRPASSTTSSQPKPTTNGSNVSSQDDDQHSESTSEENSGAVGAADAADTETAEKDTAPRHGGEVSAPLLLEPIANVLRGENGSLSRKVEPLRPSADTETPDQIDLTRKPEVNMLRTAGHRLEPLRSNQHSQAAKPAQQPELAATQQHQNLLDQAQDPSEGNYEALRARRTSQVLNLLGVHHEEQDTEGDGQKTEPAENAPSNLATTDPTSSQFLPFGDTQFGGTDHQRSSAESKVQGLRTEMQDKLPDGAVEAFEITDTEPELAAVREIAKQAEAAEAAEASTSGEQAAEALDPAPKLAINTQSSSVGDPSEANDETQDGNNVASTQPPADQSMAGHQQQMRDEPQRSERQVARADEPENVLRNNSRDGLKPESTPVERPLAGPASEPQPMVSPELASLSPRQLEEESDESDTLVVSAELTSTIARSMPSVASLIQVEPRRSTDLLARSETDFDASEREERTAAPSSELAAASLDARPSDELQKHIDHDARPLVAPKSLDAANVSNTQPPTSEIYSHQFDGPDQEGHAADAELRLNPRTSFPLQLPGHVTRVAVSDRQVCDAVRFAPQEVALIAKRAGSTDIRIWFDGQEKAMAYRVIVGRSAAEQPIAGAENGRLQELLDELFPESLVMLEPASNKLVVRGEVKDHQEAVQILSVIRSVRLVPVVDQLEVKR